MYDLKSFRDEHGLSRADIAAQLGISESLYDKIEYGVRKPSGNFLNRFKERFPSFDMNLFFLSDSISRNVKQSRE